MTEQKKHFGENDLLNAQAFVCKLVSVIASPLEIETLHAAVAGDPSVTARLWKLLHDLLVVISLNSGFCSVDSPILSPTRLISFAK